MNPSELIQQLFADHQGVAQQAADLLPERIARAAQLMIDSLRGGGKILACGNGGSAADAQHFASELVNRFERDRVALPALALTTDSSAITSIANDSAYDEIFARQVDALSQKGDVLLAISTSGQSENVNRAAKRAIDRGVGVVALTARDGGQLARIVERGGDVGVEIRAPSESTARAQEVHLLCIHGVCAVIDAAFADSR